MPKPPRRKKDLFYWLHENGFYPQSHLHFLPHKPQNTKQKPSKFQIFPPGSLYRYEPFSVRPHKRRNGQKTAFAPSVVETSGWNGEREYSYTVIADASTILPKILDALQQNEADSAYLQMESAYRDFVDSYALAVPQEFVDEMGALLEETKQDLNFSGTLTKEEAQLCALSFLETCFGGDTSLPLDSTAKGTTYQYATVAALGPYAITASRPVMSRDLPLKPPENENVSVTAENAGAWVEVYQDGVGWLPLALTPGLESLAPEQTESGIKPVGRRGRGAARALPKVRNRSRTMRNSPKTPDNTPDGGQRTGLLAKPAFWILLIAGILLLFVLLILIRHHIILKKEE